VNNFHSKNGDPTSPSNKCWQESAAAAQSLLSQWEGSVRHEGETQRKLLRDVSEQTDGSVACKIFPNAYWHNDIDCGRRVFLGVDDRRERRYDGER